MLLNLFEFVIAWDKLLYAGRSLHVEVDSVLFIFVVVSCVLFSPPH